MDIDQLPPFHAYAPRGLFGVMVPYGNFATEAEMSYLVAPPYGTLTTRLGDDGGDMEQRLAAYFEEPRLDKAVASFGSTPLHAFGVACSATSYIIGVEREKAVFERLRERHGRPIICTTQAIRDGLEALGTRHFSLVSPYGTALTQRCVEYWSSQGYRVDAVEEVPPDADGGFHPIYTIPPSAVEASLRSLLQRSRAPVVITGTGLSSLPAVWRVMGSDPACPPILPANLCLARSMLAVTESQGIDVSQWFTPSANWIQRGTDHPLMKEERNA
jgi:maleate isomerase